MAAVQKKAFIRTYVGSYKGLFLIGLVVMALVTAGQLAGPLILRTIIDTSIPQHDLSGMLWQAVLYFAIVVVMGLLSYYGTMTIAKLGLQVVTRIKQDIFSHLLTLPVAYFDEHPVGELMARTESDTERVRDLFSRVGIVLITDSLFFAGMLIVCFRLSPTVTLYIAAGIPVALAVLIFFFGKLRAYYDCWRKYYASITARVTEYIQGFDVLKAFNRVPWAEKRLDEKSRAMRDNNVKSEIIEYTAMGGLEFIIGPGFMAAVILILGPKVLGGAMTVGTLLVFLEYGRKLLDPLLSIAENIRNIQQARVSLTRISDILNLPSEKRGGLKATFESDIEFRHVWFSYKEDEWVLKDVSFKIPKASMFALVGPSGSGKTTIVSLLCRFYDPVKGDILVDGVPLRDIDLSAWRRKIGLVLQDVYLFPGSVLENVRVYNDGIDRATAAEALATVQASDLVSKLPGGLDSEIRERGSNISAGEKQLISFARAVAFEPNIVVLDEATASIDVKTEHRIKEGLERLLSGRTSVIVAHRLSSIINADEILFIKDGRIAAKGKHEELLANFADYAELVRLQFPQGEART